MKNNIKNPLNSFKDIDNKILPFFSNPILLKRIEDKKKNKDLNQINPQKKLIYNIIKLNEKLVKFTTSIKNYNLNIDSFYLTEAGNKLAETEFILFIRNNLYYNLKYRLSNILYKLERFIPVLKFHSLLYNINLFVPKRLFKPQTHIRFTYRIIQLNNRFNNMISQTESKGLFSNNKSILPKGYTSSFLIRTFEDNSIIPTFTAKDNIKNKKALSSLERRKKVLIKFNNYNLNSSFDYSISQLHKFENGRSIKFMLLKLNNLLNEINNIISIKDKLIKIIRIKNFSIFARSERNLLENVDQNIKMKENSISSNEHNFIRAVAGQTNSRLKEEGNLNGQAEFVKDQTSNQSVKNLRLKIKKINSNNNYSIENSPLLVEEVMLKENIIKIEKSKGISVDRLFNVEKDIITENSNPVDLLYFNNNLKKPVINQYLKSMSTYNMISNGAILYYSNIIGFNFKKRIRAYLPFNKSVPVLSLIGKSLQSTTNTTIKNSLSNEELNNNSKFIIRNSERLTSPYSFRDLRKVVGSLDKGKFSVFGRGIENNKLINNIYKFLYLSFKSMYCLISKPVFIIKSNKIIIQLFYFLLIPKIFKHIKSKTNYKWRNKKKIYREFIDRRKKLALAKLFETRLKEKEDALKVKYFLTLPEQLIELKDGEKEEATQRFINTKVNKTKSLQIGDNGQIQLNLDSESAKSLIKSYNEELIEIRKFEEKNSGVKFDQFGRVILKSLENKLTLKSLLFKFNKNKRSIKNKYNKILKNLNKKKGGLPYKLFFKKFYNMNNHLHIVRIPRKFAPLFKKVINTKVATSAMPSHSNINRRLNYSLRPVDKNHFSSSPQAVVGLQHKKLFKYVALTYLNIFKFKVTNPMLNRIKFKLKWFQNELIKDKSYLFSDNFKGNETPTQSRAEKNVGRNKFNSRSATNKFNWFLFKKLFWSISLSKKIIPNAKILQKLGIPQWSWPYSGIKKKGYPTQAPLNLTKSILSFSWPFSLLMSPTILKINKNINNFENDFNKQDLNKGRYIASKVVNDKEGKVRIPVIKKQQSWYKIREMFTKRYHLMKLANINLINLYPLKFEKLCEVLNSIFNKPIELDLIRLHYPYHDSNILVRLLAFMINKMKLRRITRRLFNKAVVKSIKKINNKDQVNIIPAFISGITIKVAGRLMKYKVIPRKTVKIVRRGSSSIGKVNYSDVSRYTNKNKRGSFTITIKSGHNFFN
jgi:hypothetical protein